MKELEQDTVYSHKENYEQKTGAEWDSFLEDIYSFCYITQDELEDLTQRLYKQLSPVYDDMESDDDDDYEQSVEEAYRAAKGGV